jgi:outer membrane protein
MIIRFKYCCIIIGLFCSENATFAQKTITLTECINTALKNNLQIQSQIMNTENTKVNKQQASAAFLPSVNGYATHNYNFGQTIDRFTNQFIQGKAVQSNNFYVQGAWTLFSGLQNVHALKQSEVDLAASKYDYEYMCNTIAQTVAQTYMQVLLNKEIELVAKNQLEQTKKNIETITKKVEAGNLPKLDLLSTEAQKSNEELGYITAQNNYTLTLLSLTQLMNINSNEEFNIAPIQNLDAALTNTTPANITDVYNAALKTKPELLSVDTKLRSAAFALRTAQGTVLPTLTFNASVGTGYSGQSKELIGAPTLKGNQLNGYAEFVNPLNNQLVQAPTYTPTFDYVTKTTAFGKQFKNNLNQSVGFSLQVPIFNNLRAKGAVQRAKINTQVAQINVSKAQQTLYKNVQQAVMEMNAAQNKLQATAQLLSVQKETYNQASARFNVGLLANLDYLKFKTNLAKAESDYLQSKYEYVFKKIIVQFYATNKLEID